MNQQPHYNYMALFRAVCLIVFLASLVILAINHRNRWPALIRRLRAWRRHQQGHVLSATGLVAATLWELITEVWVPMGLVALLSLACGMAIR